MTRLVTNPVREFKKNLEFAEQVDIASAWATRSQVLNALVLRAKKRHISVRAIVGTSGNVTGPDALKQLHEIGEPRGCARHRGRGRMRAVHRDDTGGHRRGTRGARGRTSGHARAV